MYVYMQTCPKSAYREGLQLMTPQNQEATEYPDFSFQTSFFTPGLLGEIVDSKAEAGKLQDEPGTFSYARK